MHLAHRALKLQRPAPVMDAETGVAVGPSGALRAILLPQQLQRHRLLLKLLMDPREVWGGEARVMQPEVLIEPAERDLQMTLLVAPSPVHVLNQPLVGAGEELSTALHARESNHGKSSAAIGATNMFKAQKLESLRPLTVVRAPLRSESAKEQQPSLLFG